MAKPRSSRSVVGTNASSTASPRFRFRKIEPEHWDVSRLEQLIHSFSKKKILVIGDVGIDRYTVGTVDRISPEAPVPIVLVQKEEHKLGLAANVADNIQALNGEAWLLGVVGKDLTQIEFKKLLKKAAISSQYLVVDPTRRTVLKERIVSERQQLLRVDYESVHPISHSAELEILEVLKRTILKVDAVIIEDYAKGMLSPNLISKVLAHCKKVGKWVAIDPNARSPLSMYRGATLLTPNTREAEKLSGVSIRDWATLQEAGKKILEQTRAQWVVLTRGKDGMALFERGNREIILIPTYAKEVYDVSGAGDTVIAVLSLAWASGASVEEAAILGNLAAGVEVGKRGTATVSPEEIRHALESYRN